MPKHDRFVSARSFALALAVVLTATTLLVVSGDRALAAAPDPVRPGTAAPSGPVVGRASARAIAGSNAELTLLVAGLLTLAGIALVVLVTRGPHGSHAAPSRRRRARLAREAGSAAGSEPSAEAVGD